MTRNILTAGLLLAGLSVAQAQTVTPGIGGVAITGQSGAGVYLPWGGGGAVVGAPGTGSYNLSTGVYTNPYSWSQYSNPTAYNFNTGTYNYNSYPYYSNGSVYNSGYYTSPYTNGNVIQSSGYYYPSSSGYYQSGSGYYYPSSNSYPSGNVYYGSDVSTPVVNTRNRGRLRWR